MFLKLLHTQKPVFETSKLLTLESYKVTRLFPQDERFVMVQQIRRAALSVHLNIAEGCSRSSQAERKRFFEIARGSVIEIDTALNIAFDLKYCTKDQLKSVGEYIVSTFKQLCGLME